MTTYIAQDVVTTILTANGLSARKLGLRSDRVAKRVLEDLRSFAEGEVPSGLTVLVSITAPIRLPARTVADLKHAIGLLVGADRPQGERSSEINGNHIRLRILTDAARRSPKLIGFVHNPDSASEPLFELAERWMRTTG